MLSIFRRSVQIYDEEALAAISSTTKPRHTRSARTQFHTTEDVDVLSPKRTGTSRALVCADCLHRAQSGRNKDSQQKVAYELEKNEP